jgi:uncharacterized Fe-S cluster protein YjdI
MTATVVSPRTSPPGRDAAVGGQRQCPMLHAAKCLRGLPAVFNRERRQWVRPNNATGEELSRVVERCPSGALQCKVVDGLPVETPAATTR